MDYKFPDKYKDYWRTSISHIDRNFITIRGYPLEEISGRVSYVDAIILCLRGELPDEVESTCMNAIFTAAMDHQFLNSTALAARTVVSANPDPIVGIAAGVLSFGKVTAGVPSIVVELVEEEFAKTDGPSSYPAVATEVVQRYRSTKQRIPGFGHPLHDMVGDHYTFRSQLLRDRVREAGLPSDGKVGFYEALHTAFLETVDKPIPINVDGVMGAVFAELGYTSLQAQALAPFTMLPGIVAHAVEEITDGVPLRIVPDSHYVGLPVRHRPGYGDDSSLDGLRPAARSCPTCTGRTSRSVTSSQRRGVGPSPTPMCSRSAASPVTSSTSTSTSSMRSRASSAGGSRTGPSPPSRGWGCRSTPRSGATRWRSSRSGTSTSCPSTSATPSTRRCTCSTQGRRSVPTAESSSSATTSPTRTANWPAVPTTR